jgi:hypothetical protein
MKNNFYVYAYIRSKDSTTAKAGTPYYIGKGSKERAFSKHHNSPPPKKNYIVFLEQNLSEVGALALERRYIKWWGRKDLGFGILNNKTDGGEGITNPSTITREKLSNAKRNESAETRLKRSIAAKNRLRNPCSIETKEKISKSNVGRKRLDESKKKMSDAAKGKIKSIETKEKIKKKLENRPKPVTTCTKCGKVGGISAMIRWHFNNCKNIKEN